MSNALKAIYLNGQDSSKGNLTGLIQTHLQVLPPLGSSSRGWNWKTGVCVIPVSLSLLES